MIPATPATDPDQVDVMRKATAAELDAARRALDRAEVARQITLSPDTERDFELARDGVFNRLAAQEEWA